MKTDNNNKFMELILKLNNTGFVHIFGSGVINQIIGFLSGIILVRIISKSDYGVYSYTNNLMSFFMLFSGFGVVSGLLQICSENSSNSKLSNKIFSYGFRIGIIFNLILGVFVLLVAILVEFPIPGSNQLLVLMSALPVFLIIYELIQIYFRYNKLNRKYSYYSTLNTFLILIFSIFGALTWSTRGLIIFRYFGYIVSIIIGIYLSKLHNLKLLK